MQQVGDAYEIRMPMRPETKLQMMAADDVGAFVTLALGRPDEWIGRELEIAGDELTMAQIAEAIQIYSGIHTDYVQVPVEEMRAYSEDSAACSSISSARAIRPTCCSCAACCLT